jgi:hypothetical protein
MPPLALYLRGHPIFGVPSMSWLRSAVNTPQGEIEDWHGPVAMIGVDYFPLAL